MLRVAVSKVRMPRSHRITLGLPSAMMYSAAESSSSIEAAMPRLSRTGRSQRPTAAQQVEVLHVAGADLEQVDRGRHPLDLVDAHHLADHRQPAGAAGLGQQPDALPAQALEGVGRGARLERAAAQHDPAGRGDRLGGGQDLLARLDAARPADHHEVAVADDHPADLDPRAGGGVGPGDLGEGGLGRRGHRRRGPVDSPAPAPAGRAAARRRHRSCPARAARRSPRAARAAPRRSAPRARRPRRRRRRRTAPRCPGATWSPAW